jgi:protein phosphatase
MNEQSVRCPICGTPARPGARFCTRCGTDLATALPQLPGVAAAPSLPAGDEAPTVPREMTRPRSEAPTVAHRPPADGESVTLTGMQAIRQRALRQNSGTATHAGRVRSHNEDYVAKIDYSLDQSGAAEPMGLYIVADGMGGYKGGEKASRDSVRQAFRDFIEGHILQDLRAPTRKLTAAEAGSPVEETLRTLVAEANRLVHRKRQETGSKRGTTLTALLIVGSKAAVANVGDSRTYLLRNGQLRQLTQDHSLVFSLFKAGQISEDEIYTHPQKNEIYRSLGEQEDVKIDTQTLDIAAGDRLLLCSDGLWEMVRNGQIATILGSATTPQAACDRLVATAFDNGGEDNISAIAVYLE